MKNQKRRLVSPQLCANSCSGVAVDFLDDFVFHCERRRGKEGHVFVQSAYFTLLFYQICGNKCDHGPGKYNRITITLLFFLWYWHQPLASTVPVSKADIRYFNLKITHADLKSFLLLNKMPFVTAGRCWDVSCQQSYSNSTGSFLTAIKTRWSLKSLHHRCIQWVWHNFETKLRHS